ncbi:MAG TPA: PAS domain-containing protein [Steroidobacteraceae bacterium]|nr:PAS domain-containing protein [Steroidobacteraceae bacterium]
MDRLAHAAESAAESPWLLFDLVGSGVAVTTADGALEYCNPALLRLLAQTAKALSGTSIFALLDAGANNELERLHRTVLATNSELRTQVRSFGGRFVAGAVLRRFESVAGQRVIWSFVDARCNEPAPELALWGTEIGLWDWDVVNDRLTWINDWCEHSQLAAFSGYGHEQLWSSRIHPEDLPAYREALTRHLDGHTPPYDVEYRLRNRDDVWVWIQERGRVIERDPSGRAWRMVGLCLDAEERHNSARALERSEARLAHAVWATSVGLWDHDISNDTVYWWNDWCASLDLDPCTGPGHSARWDANVHPDDLPWFERRYETIIAGGGDSYEVEYRIRTRSGGWRWVLSRGRPTARDATGRAVRNAGVTIDIDARKRMELALRDSEARLEAAIWGADLGLWDWKLEDDSLVWLSDWPTRYGIVTSGRAVRRDAWVDRVHPLDRQKYAAEDHALTYDGRNAAESDYRIQSSSGDWRWVNVRTRVIERNAAGKAMRIVGACIDVDSRRRAEQMLRTQALILETMREGVVLVTLNGRIEFTNPAFDRMFGRKCGELTGTSVLDLFYTWQLQSSAAGLEGLLDLRGRGGKRDMSFRRRDGSQFAGEVLSAEIDLSGDKRILVVVQDVSERRQLESEIIEIANRERRRLGADLHDGLGQELTGISLMMRSLAKRASLDAIDATPELNEIITLVNHAIQSSRKMALGISPVTLERGGLLPALQTLVTWSRDSYNIDVRLRLAIRSPLLIGESAAAHLYLIVQEAINNAVRHGRARSIAVALRTNEMLVSLSITDDGVGIAEDPGRGAGMGIKLMQYRCAVIGGVMRIRRLPGGGTRIHSVCPQDAGAGRFEQERHTPAAS